MTGAPARTSCTREPEIELIDATDKSHRFDSMENSVQSWLLTLMEGLGTSVVNSLTGAAI